MDIVRKGTALMLKITQHWKCPAVFMCDCNTGQSAASMKYLESGNAGGMRFQMASTGVIDHILFQVGPFNVGKPINPRILDNGPIGTRREVWGMADHPPVFVDVDLQAR